MYDIITILIIGLIVVILFPIIDFIVRTIMQWYKNKKEQFIRKRDIQKIIKRSEYRLKNPPRQRSIYFKETFKKIYCSYKSNTIRLNHNIAQDKPSYDMIKQLDVLCDQNYKELVNFSKLVITPKINKLNNTRKQLIDHIARVIDNTDNYPIIPQSVITDIETIEDNIYELTTYVFPESYERDFNKTMELINNLNRIKEKAPIYHNMFVEINKRFRKYDVDIKNLLIYNDMVFNKSKTVHSRNDFTNERLKRLQSDLELLKKHTNANSSESLEDTLEELDELHKSISEFKEHHNTINTNFKIVDNTRKNINSILQTTKTKIEQLRISGQQIDDIEEYFEKISNQCRIVPPNWLQISKNIETINKQIISNKKV